MLPWKWTSLTGASATLEEELQHLDHRADLLDVGGRVLLEDVDQVFAVAEQPLRA